MPIKDGGFNPEVIRLFYKNQKRCCFSDLVHHAGHK